MLWSFLHPLNRISQLDALYNPGLSRQEMRKAKQIERERRRRKKAKKKQKGKELAAASTEDDDNEA